MVMPIGMVSMGAPTGNVYQHYRQRYGCGYADFGTSPKVASYPMDITPLGIEIPKHKNRLIKFLEKIL